MARTQYFLRMTHKNFVRLINVSEIRHAEYRNAPDLPSETRAELYIWFSDCESAEPLVMYGHAATVAWDALNELTIRAVLSLGD